MKDGLPKAIPNTETPQNKLLDTSLHSREKKYSSTHQNTDTRFPKQETLTSHLYKPTHREKAPQYKGNTNFHPTERTPQTQHSKQNEKTEKYSAGKGT